MERYTYEEFAHTPNTQYLFASLGSQGPINKMITFSHFGNDIFNMSLEDIDEDTGVFDQYAVTNNGDTMKILLTVAEILVHFTSKRPGAQIFIKGNTVVRNRLYRIYIAKFLDEIRQWYEVYGLRGAHWEVFERQGKYGAYLVIRVK
ncbi:DUF6934 family protein [Chitinophaga costaii]|nr:hypothetical protein [Chitinophaga costaii]